MRTTTTLATLLALALFASLTLPGTASGAIILASWDVWGDTGKPLLADYTATGITAAEIDGSNLNGSILTTGGNIDGTFGSLSGASDSDTRFAQGVINTTTNERDVQVNITNSTGGPIKLDYLHFDMQFPNYDAYSVTFTNVTQNTTTGVLGSAASLTSAWTSIDIDASNANGMTLAHGESGRFIITLSSPDGSGRNNLDNVAITGTAIPEPASLVLLGAGLLGLALYGWRRRR